MTTGETVDFKGMCEELRGKLKKDAAHLMTQIVVAKINGKNFTSSNADRSEMIANLTLTYRHLEDASMRLGKAIQAFDGGISVYDQNQPERDLSKEVPSNNQQ